MIVTFTDFKNESGKPIPVQAPADYVRDLNFGGVTMRLIFADLGDYLFALWNLQEHDNDFHTGSGKNRVDYNGMKLMESSCNFDGTQVAAEFTFETNTD